MSPNTTSSEDLRVLIREEAREMEERNKRSSIIRGVDLGAVTQVSEQFRPVARHLLVCQEPLSTIVRINNREEKLYKMDDLNLRKRLLNSAESLKNSTFSHFYINGDVTYKQRRELAECCELMGRLYGKRIRLTCPTHLTLLYTSSVVVWCTVVHGI